MRTHSHRIAVGATLVLTAACVGRSVAPAYVNPHASDEIGTVRQMYDGSLTPTLAVNTFRNIDRLFPTRVVAHGGTPYPLPLANKPLGNIAFTSKGVTYTADDYIRLNRIAGLLVLKNGRIALEHYEFGNGPQTRWMSMSVAKSITSTLMGAAVRDGKIGSLEDLVTKYVPRLVGSAYDGVTIRQLLMMSSGVRWNETYTDSSSDRRHLLEAQIAQRAGGAIELMRSLPRAAPPGTLNSYSTGETQIAGEVVRGAVGMSLAQYLHDRIWAPFGMETDATWWLDSPDGHEIGGSGFNATLRDYARFGLFFANGGVIGDTHVLPDGWTLEASSPKTLANQTPLNYGYMWWPIGGAPGSPDAGSPNEGAFAAEGIFGQAIYINTREHVVIAQWGAQTKPTGGAKIEDNDFFAAVVCARCADSIGSLSSWPFGRRTVSGPLAPCTPARHFSVMDPQSQDGPGQRPVGDLTFEAFRLLRDLPLIGVALTSPASKRWLQVNQTLCDFLGYSHEELVSKTWSELTHPDDLDDDVADFDRVMRGESNGYQRDKRYIRRDGSIAYGTIVVQAVRNAEGQVEYFIATVADVGARVEAEARARRAAALLGKLSEQVPGVIYQYLLLPDGRSMFPFASDGIRDIYEVAPEDVREDATVVFTRLHPDDLSRVADSIAESARTLAPWGCDYRVVLPQKGVRWVRGDARPERLSDDSTLWHGFIRDSTEQQLAREALQESERRYRVQIEHAPEAIVVFDVEQNRFADANSNAERLFGLSRDALLARGIAEVSPPTQPDGRSSAVAGREFITRALGGESPVFEWVHHMAGSADITCEVRLVTLPYNGRVMVRGSITDMTERKRSRDALRRLNAAIDSSINGVAMCDLDGRLTYANRAMLELFGYSDAADVLGRDVRSFWANDDKIGTVIASIQATGAWSGERTAVRRDGSTRFVQVNASVFADSNGVPIGMLASIADMTENKRLQTELLQAQKMESVGRLAGGIAHDFNNLLTIIAAYLDFAVTGVDTDSDLFRDLLEVRRAADSAASLTQQLLAFSRKQIIAPKELDLNEVVHRVHGMLKRLLGEDIELILTTAPDLGYVRFDPGQAEQILVNLAANARDAMPSGGKLTLETSNVHLGDDYTRAHPGASAGDFVLLAVTDTGVGMSEEVRAHAFEPFFTTKESGRGTGLGLAMIDGAVSQNGGRVEVYSEVGHGTSFKIYLPRVQAFETGPSTVDRPLMARRGHETIVVAEDEQSVRTLIGRILGSRGYRVFAFNGGAAALEWIRTSDETIDLLLTDVIMPGMNGRELAEHVATLRPATRILFASGYTANVIVHHGVLKPGVNFLAKPFTAEELSSKVRETIDALSP